MKILQKIFNREDIIFTTFQYYSLIFLFIVFYTSTYLLGNPWIVVLVLYGIVPLMDFYLGVDERNPTKEEMKVLRRNNWFKLPLYLSIAHDWFALVWSIWYVQTSSVNLLCKAGVIFAVAHFQGSSINLSHEINHKPNIWENIVGTLNLSKSLYMHFLIEHNMGHHKFVSTERDPASSRKNEDLYAFLPRSVIGSFKSAWHLENERCIERYKTAFSVNNRMIWITLSDIFGPLAIWYFFNFTSMVLFLIIAITSFTLLEVINYIEHYGLSRKEISPGVYENVNISHSWNAPHRISNYILFKLQRHSDHHENSLKPYQTLCSYEQSPTLPQGYTVCILMATYPKLWFEVMNPILETYHDSGKPPSKELTENSNKIILSFIYQVISVCSGICFLQMGANFLF